MKISVNRAIKYRNLLAAAIATVAIPTVANVRFETEQALIDGTKVEAEKAADIMKNKMTDIDSLYALRGLIEQANTKGASAILNDIARTEECSRVAQSILLGRSRGNDHQTVMDSFNMKKRLEEVDATKIVGAQIAPMNLFSKEELEELENFIAESKKAVEDLKETRNAMNLEVQVVLPEGVIESLKRHKIV